MESIPAPESFLLPEYAVFTVEQMIVHMIRGAGFFICTHAPRRAGTGHFPVPGTEGGEEPPPGTHAIDAVTNHIRVLAGDCDSPAYPDAQIPGGSNRDGRIPGAENAETPRPSPKGGAPTFPRPTAVATRAEK